MVSQERLPDLRPGRLVYVLEPLEQLLERWVMGRPPNRPREPQARQSRPPSLSVHQRLQHPAQASFNALLQPEHRENSRARLSWDGQQG